MRSPLLILVSGAPGAGKSTLAHKLAQHFRIPHIPRDEVMRSIELTYGEIIDRKSLWETKYYPLLVHMLRANMSVVADGTLYKGLSEAAIKKFLLPHAHIVNVHVRASDEQQRFLQRELEREGWSSEWVHDHRKELDAIYDQTVDPLDLGIDVIEVDATDGYEPSVTDIIKQIRQGYRDTRPGLKEEIV